jgi:hypothetical protein
MHTELSVPRPGWRDNAGALVLYAVIVAVSLVLGALRPHTAATMFGSAAVIAAGTIALALYLARWTPYPRWAFLGAAVLLASGVMLSPLVQRDPQAWAQNVRPMLWMHPWFFLVMARPNAGGKPAWCAPQARHSGWVLIATAAVMASILWGATMIARLI